MATQFVPVEMSNVERGKFVAECEKTFSKLQKDFVKHVDEYDFSANAVLNMAVKIAYDKAKKSYAIVTDITPKLPKKPSGVTTAFVAENDKGQRTLFTQSAGTSKRERVRTIPNKPCFRQRVNRLYSISHAESEISKKCKFFLTWQR